MPNSRSNIGRRGNQNLRGELPPGKRPCSSALARQLTPQAREERSMKVTNNIPNLPQSPFSGIRKFLFGPARDFQDPSIGHKISLIAFFAWVGLGADGLSSSAYGPEEAFRTLGQHTYLVPFLVLATALTVFIISYAYSRIIEHFPMGGGGYVVATALLGKQAGVVSGCALLVDYILTITVSIASGGDALFSLLPYSMHYWKLPVEFAAILFLMVMNIRGVKESVSILVPIFLIFILTHLFLILGNVFIHLPQLPEIAGNTVTGLKSGVSQLGMWGLFLVFLRSYSLGGGTYTGIEAVSNGIGILKDPKVETGKRTMKYMAISLAFTAGGLLLCYMLSNVRPVEGQTLNAVLANNLMGSIHLGSLNLGTILVFITIASEAILLLVAAQTGFIDGPRVMANMAVDFWLPRRFTNLSNRLTIQNGVLLISLVAIALLAYTRGSIGILVVMYSLNVFLTFSLSEIGMLRFWFKNRKSQSTWKKNILIHGTGFILCFSIFWVMVIEKIGEGAWLTIVITCVCIGLCFMIRRHYDWVNDKIKEIDRTLENVPAVPEKPIPDFDPNQPTAVILVGGYSGLGKHIFLNIFRLFPGTFKNVVFVSIGAVNSDFFKDTHYVETLRKKTIETLESYKDFARRMGIPAVYEYQMGTEIVESVSEFCVTIAQKYPRAVFFGGELVFERPHWYHRILHNDASFAISRKIRFAGLPLLSLPIRIREKAAIPQMVLP